MNDSDPPPRRNPPSSPTAPSGSEASDDGEASQSFGTGRCEVPLQNPCGYPETGVRRWRPWIREVVAELSPAAESFAVRFVSDREMKRLNGTYRGLDRTTDVLSFPGDDTTVPGGSGPVHLGDVAIAVPTARRQAGELGHSVEREIRTLLLHGVLHCMGYDHETDDGTMERVESHWRSRFVDGR